MPEHRPEPVFTFWCRGRGGPKMVIFAVLPARLWGCLGGNHDFGARAGGVGPVAGGPKPVQPVRLTPKMTREYCSEPVFTYWCRGWGGPKLVTFAVLPARLWGCLGGNHDFWGPGRGGRTRHRRTQTGATGSFRSLNHAKTLPRTVFRFLVPGSGGSQSGHFCSTAGPPVLKNRLPSKTPPSRRQFLPFGRAKGGPKKKFKNF